MLFVSYMCKNGFGSCVFKNYKKIINEIDLIDLKQAICNRKGFKSKDVTLLYWKEF